LTPDASDASETPAPAQPGRRLDLLTGVIALVLGTVFVFAIPALGGYDEYQHVNRAWQVSDGGVFARVRFDLNEQGGRVKGFGGDVPQEFLDDMSAILSDGVLRRGDAGEAFSHLNDRSPGGPRRFAHFNGAAVYSPVPYLPAAAMIRVGRWFGLSTFAMILLARLAQVLAYAAIVTLAVRRIPRRKLVLAAFAIAPVALVQAGTVNADAMTIALALLVVAEAFRLADLAPENIRAPHFLEAGAALVALGLAKQPYFVVALFFAMPMWKYRGRIAATLGGVFAGAAAIALAWNSWAQSHYVPPNNTVFAGDKRTSFAYVDVDPDAQFSFVRSHPFSFLGAIGRTIGHYPGSFARDMVTQSPLWKAGVILVVLAFAVLVFALLVDGVGLEGGALTRSLAAGIAVLLVLAVFLGGYAGWNAVGAPRIDEIQGRYFLPALAVLALAAVPTIRTRLSNLAYAPYVLGSSVLVTLAIALGLTRHFYL
jgi:uncharacterized membrane protein